MGHVLNAVEECNARKEKMIEALKKAGNEGLTRGDLSKDLGVSGQSITNYLRSINKMSSRIRVVKTGNNERLFWGEESAAVSSDISEEVKTEPEKKPAVDLSEIDRYKETKNDEGYGDPTAYAAMKSMDIRFKPGDIWINDYNGLAETYFVLAATTKAVTCVPLVKSLDKVPECERADMVPLRYSSMVNYYFNPTKIYTKPARYFKERVGYFGKAFELVSGKVNAYLKLCPVDRVEVPVVIDRDIPPVEKIVEKEVKVEVPVEIEVEKIVYKDDPELKNRLAELEKELRETKELLAMSEHENELKTQRGDIWESVAKSLLNKKGA